MAFDAVISDTAETFTSNLAREDRKAFHHALDILLSDPYPDGVIKVALTFPFKPGVFGFEYGDFWIAYTFINPQVLGIIAAFWSPKSPRYPIDI